MREGGYERVLERVVQAGRGRFQTAMCLWVARMTKHLVRQHPA